MSLKGKDSKPIVHIATDEKFIDAAYDIYEQAFPKKNLFLILRNEDDSEIKYLSKKNEYHFINTDAEFIKEVEKLTKEACIIVFHGMNFLQAALALNLKKSNKKYLWTVFGAEVYNNYSIIDNKSIGKKTYNKFVLNGKEILKSIIRPWYYRFGNPKGKVVKQSFSKMDYIGILYKEELDNYHRLGLVNSGIGHIKFTYYPLDTVIKSDSGFVNAENILLGNSASYSNNHVEAFDLLKNLELGSHKIITTLSYGNQEYADQITKYGKQSFGDNFEPLTKFLPLSEYQKILQSCGIVIMNHYRQQAVGNVMNALYIGAKVYLSRKNTLYHYLKRIGCHVFCIEEDLVPDNATVFELLSKNQMIENREILKDELSLERVINELKQKLTPVLN